MTTSEIATEVLPNGHHGHSEWLLTFSSSVPRYMKRLFNQLAARHDLSAGNLRQFIGDNHDKRRTEHR